MTALSPKALALLDVLCTVHEQRGVRVTRVSERYTAEIVQLSDSGLVKADFLPSPWALHDWRQRRTETAPAPLSPRVEEKLDRLKEIARPVEVDRCPPAPKVGADGGDAVARTLASPPDEPGFLNRLLDCFGDEFETLRVVAQRFGAKTPQKIVRHARTLHERGLIEQSGATNGQPFCLWRRSPKPFLVNGEPVDLAELPDAVVEQLSPETQRDVERAKQARNTRGASGAHGRGRERAPEGGKANGPTQQRKRRTPDTAASTHSVDLKVNARRDPTQPPHTPEMDWADQERLRAARTRDIARKRVTTEAKRALAEGKPGRNYAIRGAMAEIQRHANDKARTLDEVEEAKLVLRRRGYNVFDAEVSGGPKGKFYVGSKLVTKAELLAMAGRCG